MGLKDECGVAGIIGDPSAANLVYLCLFAQQHRGQEGCGIASFEAKSSEIITHSHKSFGLVAESFSQDILNKLHGDSAIGHVRYSTQGGHFLANIQPFYFKSRLGPLAIAHNGNLTNGEILRQELESSGSIFQSTSDTEVFVHLIARAQSDLIHERIFAAMKQTKGAYSLIILAKDCLYAVRDPFGFRPLVIGKKNDCYVVVSESCALDLIDATLIREVKPGEVVAISKDGVINSYFPLPSQAKSFCAFEPIYFARPDSQVFGTMVYQQRKNLGRALAEEAPVPNADLVIAVPDSGVPMALGFSEYSGTKFEAGLVRNHYVGRTFIQPAQDIRDFGVRLKLNPIPEVLKNKNVVVVDDSLVRGTTAAKIIRMIRQAGANQIHVRIGSPPITHSCFYGVDTPKRENLMAAQMHVNDIQNLLGCDSLGYLSIEGLRKTLRQGLEGDQHCMACFNGNYPEKTFTEITPQPTDKLGTGLLSRSFSKSKS